jgi:hypothetical protein
MRTNGKDASTPVMVGYPGAVDMSGGFQACVASGLGRDQLTWLSARGSWATRGANVI